MFQELRASLALLILFTLLTGIGYPLFVSSMGQALFPRQAGGSLAEQNGTIIGSELIGPPFTSSKYFRARPSAAGNGYDASNSSGSNLAPTAPDFIKTIAARVADLRQEGEVRPIPVDLVTASASGLDPDISIAAADFQASHVAVARGLSITQIENLIAHNTTPRAFGILGEPYVNVLAINRALDVLAPVALSSPPDNAPPEQSAPPKSLIPEPAAPTPGGATPIPASPVP
jgi:K+-transporting ATPase ATPase C chain